MKPGDSPIFFLKENRGGRLLAGPMTKLDAVNRMLLSIGEQPVSSLTVSGVIEVAVAVMTLEDTAREVQERGWQFNTDEAVELLPDNSGNILVPASALKIDTVGDSENLDVTTRNNGGAGFVLWDREEQSDVFDAPVTCDIVYNLDWEDMPQCARWYITIRAARRFAQSATQSTTLYSFTEKDEREAEAALKDADGENADYNLFTESWLPYKITHREGSIL